jgi:hypothetical protein
MPEHVATMLELPLMFAASWFASGWLVRVFGVPRDLPARVTMGACAFALLMLAEFATGAIFLGRGLAAHLASYRAASA